MRARGGGGGARTCTGTSAQLAASPHGCVLPGFGPYNTTNALTSNAENGACSKQSKHLVTNADGEVEGVSRRR